MSANSSAVFLSYASQDAEAVERIAEALRAAGVEVWFDRNELVGGDAWDRKIRQQIRECALFVPVISAATQARGEGYFRLEWKLAVDRSHLMAPDQPFLLPVVIDDTPDAAARVADEFRAVQWTRLHPVGYAGQARSAGEDPALEKFCTRVKRLLGGELAPTSDQRTVGASLDDARGRGPAAPLRKPSRPWLVRTALIAAVALVVLAFWQAWKRNAAPLSEARKIVAQARAMIDAGDDANHEVFYLAEDLLKRAHALDDGDGEVWAAQAQVSWFLYWMGYDRSSARRELVRTQAERAVKLAPDSPEAQIAYAGHLIASDASMPDGIKALEELARRVPTDRRVFRMLAHCYSMTDRLNEAVATFDRAHAIPGGDPIALVNKSIQLFWHGRYAEAELAVAQSLALKVTGRGQMTDVLLKLCWRGDLHGAGAALERWPAWLRLEDRGVFLASQVWLWRREPDKAVTALNAVTRDVFNDSFYLGPRSTFLALAHEQAGRTDAARAEWENVLKVADRFLATDPSAKSVLASKACALIRLGRVAEATAIVRELEQINELRSRVWSCDAPAASLRIALGRADEVVKKFDTDRRTAFMSRTPPAPRAALRHNPVFDPIRATPEFQRWMESAPAPGEKMEAKSASAGPGPAPNEKSAPADKSLVVLPLENLSPDPENAFFTEGMHFEIIQTLSRIAELRVISRDSALALKGSTTSLAEKAQKVGVGNVLTGSVRRAGTSVRISLELRRARDEAMLWTQTYNKELGEGLLTIQGDVAEQIGKILQARLSAGTFAGARFLTRHAAAHDLFLKARQLQNDLPDRTRNEQTVAWCEEALAIDPEFASAAGLASTVYVDLYRSERDTARRAAHASAAKRHAETMSRLIPGGGGDAALSYYYVIVEPDNARSIACAENAVRAFPNDAGHHNQLAQALWSAGRVAEGLEPLRRARALDPLSVEIPMNEIAALAQLRRWDEWQKARDDYLAVFPQGETPTGAAHRLFRRNGEIPVDISVFPVFWQINWLWRSRRFDELDRRVAVELTGRAADDLAAFPLRLRQVEARQRLGVTTANTDAAALLTAALRLPEYEWRESFLARAQALAGQSEEAIRTMRRWLAAASGGNSVSQEWARRQELAELYARVGRPRECVELLAKLLSVPSGLTVPMLKADPAWDNVRDDPAFKALLADPQNSAPL